MKIRDDIMNAVLVVIVCLLIYVAFISDAKAWNPRHDHSTVTETHVIELQPVVTYETQVTELVNTTNITNYTPDECAGVAIAMAGANNTMYMGTKKAQLSLGLGECSGDIASSLMFGGRINNNLFINGNWATDNEVNTFGVGGTWVFK